MDTYLFRFVDRLNQEQVLSWNIANGMFDCGYSCSFTQLRGHNWMLLAHRP